MLIVVGINNKLPELTALVKSDFTTQEAAIGQRSVAPFQVWILAIFMAGALGYVKSLRPIANAFLVLIVIVLLLSHKGFVTQFTAALEGKKVT